MWTISTAIANSDTLRCTPSITKRGQRVLLKASDVRRRPSTTLAVRSSSVTAPVARVRYHRALGPAVASNVSSEASSGSGQPAASVIAPSRATSRAGSPRNSSHSGARSRAENRRRAGDVGVDAAARRHADGPPAAVGRPAARRVQYVVQLCFAPTPAPNGRARRREPAGSQRDRLSGGVQIAGVVVGDADRPAAGRYRPGGGDVAADADEQSAPQRFGCGRGGDIGGKRLRGRPVVQLDAGRHAHRRAGVVELDPPPAGGSSEAQRPPGPQGGEVAVVARGSQRGADRGIEVAVGQLRRAQRTARGAHEQPAHRDSRAAGCIDPTELRIVTEAAARPVDAVDHLAHGRRSAAKLPRVGRHHHDAGSERSPARRLPPVGGRVHEPPETATGGAAVGVGVDAGAEMLPPELTGGTVAGALWLAAACVDAAWPWKESAAITASAPDRPTAPAAIQRVALEIRRRPASRARTARGLAAWPASSSDIWRIFAREGTNPAKRRMRTRSEPASLQEHPGPSTAGRTEPRSGRPRARRGA